MRVHSIVIDVNLLFKIFHPHHHLSIPFIEPFWGVTFLHSKDIKREKYVADQTDLNQISTHNVPCLKWSCLLFLNLETRRKKMRSKLGIFCCLTCHCALLLSWFNSFRNLMPNHKKYEIVVPRSNFRATQTVDLVNTLNFLSPTVKIDCPPCLFWFLPFPGNWLSSQSSAAYWINVEFCFDFSLHTRFTLSFS